jgi:hypothetical protein
VTYAILRQAILDRKQVICTFRGYRREMCPHVIGTSKMGVQQLLSFQFAGQSSSGLPARGEWRCMPVAEIQNVQTREGPWHTGYSYLKPQTCVHTIDVEI